MSHKLLDIKNLHVSVNGIKILHGINLTINSGEIHVIMGPNGSGKSTLANVLAGHPDYKIESGSIHLMGDEISNLSAEEIAWKGLFLGFQYPVEIPGISNIQFLKTAYNNLRKKRNEKALDAVDFLRMVKNKLTDLKIPEEFLYRSINEGFSGGEKKRNEILQMSIFEPKIAVLDEIDSGVDVDALRIIAEGINSMARNTGFLLVTHYQRLLDHVTPDKIHVFIKGKNVTTGDKSLALDLENKGYDWVAGIERRADCGV